MNHKLSQTDIETLLKCIENETEIPEDLLPKLNPSFFDKLAQENKFDYQKLEKYKIPTIEYAGKRSEALILSQAGLMGGGSPLQVERCFESNSQTDPVEGDDWKNLIIQGDNLQFLKTCYLNQDPLIKDKVKGKVKLIYIDPPFGTGDEYGGNDGEISYTAKIKGAEFIESVRERLIFLKELLADDGNIFVRIDYHFGHSIKLVMDEVFGSENFNNEIIINRFKRQLRGLKQFNVSNDVLLFYSKTKGNNYFQEVMRSRLCSFCGSEREPSWIPMSSPGIRRPPERVIFGNQMLPPKGRHWTFRQETIDVMEKEGRIRIDESAKYTDLDGNSITGVPYYLQTDDSPTDSDWTDLRGYVRSKRYPTENPEELLERVIQCASQEGDLVIDCFGGSGTTGAVAEKMGRKWILCDFGKHSIYTMQARLLEIDKSPALGENSKGKHGKPAKPFCVVSVGAYDFQRIMNLRENKSAYIDFVLSLFGVTDRAPITEGEYSDEYAHKFKVANVYAQKDGNPVEVYPIWEDDYLKNIKIDEEYLEGIIAQAGGKLKGPYYIIAPETCDVVGDTKIGETEFNILSFPYKILEEASRNFQLTEQPSSADNINDLVSSVGFYFNEEVDVGAQRHKQGIQIKRFVTSILNAEGNHYESLDGLAMILLDKDYDGNTFRIEEAIYHKDISEEGVCKVSGLTDKVALIAVDKHGNESKLITL